MSARLKAGLPLALVIGVLAFAWTEVALNFTFHWVTDGDLGNGLSLPSNFHLIVPAAFVSWGFLFAAGADTVAFTKVTVASVVGGLAALGAMAAAAATADLPDFWGISLWVGIFAVVLVLLGGVAEGLYVPATFGAFAATFFWWTATGLDGWAADGGGVGNSLRALADPATAGAGAFGGVISTPLVFVWLNVTVSLLCGCVLGLASVRLSALLTPASETAPVSESEVHGAAA
ncbi:hypothetical protein BH11ACT8_BH11ACT8_04670 [soil metagenome]